MGGYKYTPAAAPSVATMTGLPAEAAGPTTLGLSWSPSAPSGTLTYSWGHRLAASGGSWATSGFDDSTIAAPSITRPTVADYEVRCVVQVDGVDYDHVISAMTAAGAGSGVSEVLGQIDFSAMAIQSLADGTHTIDGETFNTDDSTGTISIVAAGARMEAPSGDFNTITIDLGTNYAMVNDDVVRAEIEFDITSLPAGALVAVRIGANESGRSEHDFRVQLYNDGGNAELQGLKGNVGSWTTGVETFNGGTVPAAARIGLDVHMYGAIFRGDTTSGGPTVASPVTFAGDGTSQSAGVRMTTSAAPTRLWAELMCNAGAAASGADVVITRATFTQLGADE